MLTHLRKLHLIGTVAGHCVPHWRNWTAILAAICCAVPASVGAQNGPGYGPQGMPAAVQYQQAPPRSAIPQPPIQQVQNTPQSARMIHQLIEDMPQSQEELEIIQRRSQLVVTRANVLRVGIALADLEHLAKGVDQVSVILGTPAGRRLVPVAAANRPNVVRTGLFS